MAPARKKAGRAASKTDSSNNSGSNTNTTNNTIISSSAAGSTKQRVPPQPVSTRPKRHAEKRFYDDIEDERPQHLSSKNARKKSGEWWSGRCPGTRQCPLPGLDCILLRDWLPPPGAERMRPVSIVDDKLFSIYYLPVSIL